MITTTSETLPAFVLNSTESTIRKMAATMVNAIDTRRVHPTFGVTKQVIRDYYQRMAGAIGVYAVLTGQTLNEATWMSTTFAEQATTDWVNSAKLAYANFTS